MKNETTTLLDYLHQTFPSVEWNLTNDQKLSCWYPLYPDSRKQFTITSPSLADINTITVKEFFESNYVDKEEPNLLVILPKNKYQIDPLTRIDHHDLPDARLLDVLDAYYNPQTMVTIL